MTPTSIDFSRVLENLRRQRDELNLQIHLGKAEARHGWQKLELRWQQLKPKLRAGGSEALRVGRNVLAGVRLIVDELRKGCAQIRNRLR